MGYRLLPFCTTSTSSSLTSCIGSLSNAAEESDSMLFSLVYEKRPLQVKADYKCALSLCLSVKPYLIIILCNILNF